MILHTLPSAFGQRNPSPFCLKSEMALKYLNLDFSLNQSLDLPKAPKKKMPWLEDDGTIIADSELILNYLDVKSNGGLFGSISEKQKAVGTAFVRLAEDHLYWLIIASRWLDDDWFSNVERDFFGTIPAPIRWLAVSIARNRMKKTLDLHGLGRHNRNEQIQLLKANLNAIADQAGKEGFITGDSLTVYDFGVGSMVASMVDNKPHTWVSTIAVENDGLVAYAERVQQSIGLYCRENP